MYHASIFTIIFNYFVILTFKANYYAFGFCKTTPFLSVANNVYNTLKRCHTHKLAKQ